jgi:hypothetical protein
LGPKYWGRRFWGMWSLGLNFWGTALWGSKFWGRTTGIKHNSIIGKFILVSFKNEREFKKFRSSRLKKTAWL